MLKKLLQAWTALVAVLILFCCVDFAAERITLPAGRSDPDTVQGEPGCHGSLWKKDCEGQILYRLVYTSTSTPTVDNVRVAMLAAYAPVQASAPWNNKLSAAIELQYSQISDGTANCYRESTLRFISKNTKDRQVTGDTVAVAKAALSLYAKAAPAQFRIGVSGMTGTYGDAFDAARILSISEAAYLQSIADFIGCQ